MKVGNMRYFRHAERQWDRLYSELHPGILAKRGWIEINFEEYEAILALTEAENRASGL